ncbi:MULTISPECIES: RDD family protein [Niastella]|uniref:RDD family protein n=1 Tax=Niastella soli TaxID=2821487 RepID=A0ABS3YSB1_9BACT|nr:RDD family protein [Niastella soli]MBO9200806.1 RDD family protein [Niastella soli]
MQVDQNPTLDLLADEVYYERASTGKRFANYIIDLIVFYLFVMAIFMVILMVSPPTFTSMTSDDSGTDVLDRLMSIFFYAIFMSIVEGLLKGKSVGKYITKTRAVYLDGSRISVGTAIGRGFSRAVPLCVFSAFGDPCNPWQDRWTNTMVINDVKL